MRKEGNLLRYLHKLVHRAELCLNAVKTVTAVVGGIILNSTDTLGHKSSCRTGVNGKEDYVTILEKINLRAEVKAITIEGSGNETCLEAIVDGSHEVLVDTHGVLVVCLVEYAYLLALIFSVEYLSSSCTLAGVGEAHLVGVRILSDSVTGSGGSKSEYVVCLGELLELKAGSGGYGTERDLHTVLIHCGVGGGYVFLLVLVVKREKLELHTVKTTVCVDLVNSHLCSVLYCNAILCSAAGKRSGNTDLDSIIILSVILVTLTACKREHATNGQSRCECE